jgi:hypothetical protein
MVLFLLAFVIGEGLPPVFRMSGREQLYSLGMICLYLGLVVAWRWEGWGGLVSLLGWGLLSILAGKAAWNLPFSIPAAIGLLHLLCWWRLRGPAPPPAVVPRAVLFLLPPLALFLLLCANEIFGQPPLMTGTGPAPAAVLGTWYAEGAVPIALTIATDGSVSGAVGSQALSDARLVGNRSWFGRLMHWRTDYLIRGRLSGDGRFMAPLIVRRSELDGTLFLAGSAARPLQMNLRKR